MICGKERSEEDLRGGICRPCGEEVRREAAGGKLREKRSADRAVRASGQTPVAPNKKAR
jgi:hypothetical protein